MVFINTEGKFNDNSYLIDGLLFRLTKHLAIYVIENNGMRMMIDTGVPLAARKVVKKIKEFGLFPIHKVLLTHSHWDHVQGYEKMKKLIGDFETLASENAINNLKNPEIMSDMYGYKVDPIENVIPLKEGDIIDLNGLELEVINFFGHTMDSIAIFDKKNKNIFTGDAIIDRYDYETFHTTFMPPDFNESALLKTFQKLRDMKDKLNSISLNHFGVWTDEDFNKILNEMEDLHIKTKESIIKWYNENSSLNYIASKYHETFIPNSTIHTKENLIGLELIIEWLVNGLKISGFIK
jgi:glyoxylase-like metal-dependent hydrolase (beta-lactamase superfamily II)